MLRETAANERSEFIVVENWTQELRRWRSGNRRDEARLACSCA